MEFEQPPWEATEDGQQPVLSVSQLTQLVKGTLEMAFPSVWVSGEISNLAQPRSGHVYLTLKDDNAQIRGVMWKGTASKLSFDLEDGQQVICRGEIDVYAPRGSYQLVIREVEPQGLGALQLALKKLQQKLQAEGLFDPAHKKPLPKFPKTIAVVTSPTGAAIRDFLEVLRRRWPGVRVIIIPAKVQGQGAAKEIAAGIKQANQLAERPDVMVVGRGGGSLEDLWCFNEEAVVRAIFASEIPVISAVGHEIDVTLSDMVADRRALTPSEAAELVVPSADEVQTQLETLKHRLLTSLSTKSQAARNRLDQLASSRVFRKPFEVVQQHSIHLDELDTQMRKSMQRIVEQKRQQLSTEAARLEALSPLGILARGYSVTRTDNGEVLKSADDVQSGDKLETILEQGRVSSTVD
ncbi:MAG: exodeoxyribonuclease VII large subunit [Pirellulales bacterium]|jgi:exodeoxyribonuclease VII large subunit